MSDRRLMPVRKVISSRQTRKVVPTWHIQRVHQRLLQRLFREKSQESPPCRVARIENSRPFHKKKKKKMKGLSHSSTTRRDASQNPHRSRRSPERRVGRISPRERTPSKSTAPSRCSPTNATKRAGYTGAWRKGGYRMSSRWKRSPTS